MKWFKHDSDARHDAKLARLRMKYGLEGYGLYFFLLECIAGTVEAHNLTFELEEDAELVAEMTNIHYERINEMMTYMVQLRLFEQSDNGIITCMKLSTRTDDYTQKVIRSNDKVRRVSGQSTDSVGTMSELIEEKRREEKRNTKGRFTPPSVKEVAEYCRERKNGINPQEFVDHYETNGWMRGKTKIKDWKACVRTWEKNQKDAKSGATYDAFAGAI